MGLFFFVWFHPSVSSPETEKPLKNDFGAKQAHAESEGLPIKGFHGNPPQWVPIFWVGCWSAQFTRLNLGREIPSRSRAKSRALRVGFADHDPWLCPGREDRINQDSAGRIVDLRRPFDRMAINPEGTPGGRTWGFEKRSFEKPLSAPYMQKLVLASGVTIFFK